jgi:hypothetical protein
MSTKIIWIYWHQGWDKAPSLVQQSKSSWIRLNPDYKVYALDQKSIFDYVDFPTGIDIQHYEVSALNQKSLYDYGDFPTDNDIRRKDLNVQKISALLRSALLSKYGGVWTDATVVCTKPLSEWLEAYYGSRFFAFRTPGPDRLMSNWFIAAESESIILQRLHKIFSDFYANNYFSNQGTALGNKLLVYFNRRWCSDFRSTLKWHSWFARKVLRVYPQFMFHYTFNKLILTDSECAELWNQVKPFPAEPPHRLQNFETLLNGIEEAKREIDSGLTPMYKLNWRVDSSNPYWTAILRHLKEQS